MTLVTGGPICFGTMPSRQQPEGGTHVTSTTTRTMKIQLSPAQGESYKSEGLTLGNSLLSLLQPHTRHQNLFASVHFSMLLYFIIVFCGRNSQVGT